MKNKILLLAAMLAMVAAGMGAMIFRAGPSVSPAGPGASSNGSGGYIALPNIAGQANSVEHAKALFERKQLPQAREVINKLSVTDPGVSELKLAIDSAIEADELLQARRLVQATDSLNKLGAGPYAHAKPVLELRSKIDWEREQQAQAAYQRGLDYFDGEQFEAARSQFDRAANLKPDFRGSRGSPTAMAEASRLAKLASEALEQAAVQVKQAAYAEAAQIMTEARAEFDRSSHTDTLRRSRELRGDLEDYYNFALMMDRYQSGFATEGLEYFDKISPEFANHLQLGREAERIRAIQEITQRAVHDRSWQYAEQALTLEPDQNNAYHRQMKELKLELDSERNAQTQRLLREIDRLISAGDLETALVQAFEARRVEPNSQEAFQRHERIARTLIENVHRSSAEDVVGEKRRVYNLVLKHSLAADNVYIQARNQLRGLDQ
jgi:hypothetical protein